ncbi:hypothetical protein IAD21_00796 [Abditibacteriota bacterium]|nr:hypothetical protein IAD21_00796 [Abditibacteriota bacterium]
MKFPFSSLILAVFLAGSTAQAQTKRIYLANDDHTDFMWATDAETYDDAFVDLLDFHLKLTDDTIKNAPEFQNRFNADGSYWLWNYERQKTPAEFDQLMARVKDGHISAPLNTLVSTYGAQPAEAVLRGLYYAGRLERRYGVRFDLATANENQTLPLGLSSLFAGSGARYSWRGVCGCATKIPNGELGQRPHEIYWYTGQDGQRLLMKWHSLGPNFAGTYSEAAYPEAAIKYADTNAGFLARYVDPTTKKPYDTIGIFGFGGDAIERKTDIPGGNPEVPGEPGIPRVYGFTYVDHFHKIAQAQTTPTRQIVVSNESDFFKQFEARYGATLPSESVTYGNEWDLYSASMSETSARVKRAVEKLRAAELMATLISRKKPNFMKGRERARDEAFTALGLYWEHDWTADGPISRARRAAWEEKVAGDIDYYVDSLHADGISRLGGLIGRPGKEQRFFVLNPLGYTRTDFADFAYGGATNIHVRDLSTGQDVPHQMLKVDGLSTLRILASDVPSAGYKSYEIVDGPGTAPTDAAATVSGANKNILENSSVKIVLDGDGAISSFVDKTRGNTELAATIGGLKINDLAPNDDTGTITVENSGPVSVTLCCTSSAGLEHTTWVTLYRGSDRVDVRNRITANFSNVRYWSFGFNLNTPDVHTEEVGAILRDKLQAQGGDYANDHARYDHITVNHFADISDGAGAHGITISSPDLAFARLGNSTTANLDVSTPQINMLAGGQVDGSSLGIRGQNGNSNFWQRFSLRPHGAYNQTAAMKFALEHQNPFVTGAIIGLPTGPYSENNYSLLSINNPDVLLWALKPAEEGIAKGVVARVWNMGATGDYSATLTGGLASARRTTHIETDMEPLPVANGQVKVAISHSQLQTVRLISQP